MIRTAITLLTGAVIFTLALTPNAFAGKGGKSGGYSTNGQYKSQSKFGNTHEYRKQPGEKPRYQYKHTERYQYQKNDNKKGSKPDSNE